MNKNNSEIKDIEVDGNTARFVNVRKGKENELGIVIKSAVIPKTRKCTGCGTTLWEGLSGDLCLNCLRNRK